MLLGTAAPDAGCSTQLQEGGSPTALSQLPLAAPPLASVVAPIMPQQLPAMLPALMPLGPEPPQAHTCT